VMPASLDWLVLFIVFLLGFVVGSVCGPCV